MLESEPLLPSQGSQFQPTGRERIITWRKKTSSILESRTFHTIVIVLIAIDASCVLADLIYTSLFPDCAPAAPDMPPWLEVMSHISLSITALFLIEIPLAVWAFGPKYYNPFGRVIHSTLHLFDAAIIVTTFIFEVVLRGQEREVASLLIIFRLWRLVKLVGGVAVGAGELGEEESREFEETRQELEKIKQDLHVALADNQTLRQRLVVLEGNRES